MNMVVISFSCNGGSTWAANSLHLCAYSLKVSALFFVIFCNCILFGAMSILYLYCFRKASTRSFQERMQASSKCIYQFNAFPVKLSWKKWINDFSSLECSTIFLQYMVKWPLGHVAPLYFSNSDTLNFGGITTSGTKHSPAASPNSQLPPPLSTLNFV